MTQRFLVRAGAVAGAIGALAFAGAPALAAPAHAAGPYRITLVRPASGRFALGRQQAEIQVTVARTGRPAVLSSLVAVPSMPAMPMGLMSRTGKALGHGRYLVPLVLSMGGAYRLLVVARGPQGVGRTAFGLAVPAPFLPAAAGPYAAAGAAAALVLLLGLWRLRQPHAAAPPSQPQG